MRVDSRELPFSAIPLCQLTPCHLGPPRPRTPSSCMSKAVLTAPLEPSTCPYQRSLLSFRMRSRSSNYLIISMIIYSGVLFMAIFWYRKILSSYFLLLNLSNTVRFSQNITVLQLAAISLILTSLIVCQTLSYDVGSLFFIFLSRTSNTLICPWQKYLSMI